MKVECPSCSETFPILRAKLFSMYEPYSAVVTKIVSERGEAAKELIEDTTVRLKVEQSQLVGIGDDLGCVIGVLKGL